MAQRITVIDHPDQTLTVNLDGRRYGLRIRHNDAAQFWTLDIDVDDAPVRRGIALRGGVNLTRGLSCLPDGFGAFVYRQGGSRAQERENLPSGNSALYYITRAEIDAMAAARA